jgi:hypothetical protein
LVGLVVALAFVAFAQEQQEQREQEHLRPWRPQQPRQGRFHGGPGQGVRRLVRKRKMIPQAARKSDDDDAVEPLKKAVKVMRRKIPTKPAEGNHNSIYSLAILKNTVVNDVVLYRSRCQIGCGKLR